MISSSDSCSRAAASGTTCARVLVARSFRAATLAKEKPAARRLAIGASSTICGVGKAPWPQDVDEAPQDGVGGGAVELLMCDRPRQRLEGMAVLRRIELGRAHRADQSGEHRVGTRQMREDLFVHAAPTSGRRGNSTWSAAPASARAPACRSGGTAGRGVRIRRVAGGSSRAHRLPPGSRAASCRRPGWPAPAPRVRRAPAAPPPHATGCSRHAAAGCARGTAPRSRRCCRPRPPAAVHQQLFDRDAPSAGDAPQVVRVERGRERLGREVGEQRMLVRVSGGVQEAAEAARVVETQRFARIEHQVEMVMRAARLPARHHAYVARHSQVQQQRTGLKPQQQVLGASSGAQDALSGELPRQRPGTGQRSRGS